MAAFTGGDPADGWAFEARRGRLSGAATVAKKTALLDGRIAGHVMSFEHDGVGEGTHRLGKACWGRGVATTALREFLGHEATRPLFARAAKDNAGSIRVLEKCGFEVCGEDGGFFNARGEEVEEFVLIPRR